MLFLLYILILHVFTICFFSGICFCGITDLFPPLDLRLCHRINPRWLSILQWMSVLLIFGIIHCYQMCHPTTSTRLFGYKCLSYYPTQQST